MPRSAGALRPWTRSQDRPIVDGPHRDAPRRRSAASPRRVAPPAVPATIRRGGAARSSTRSTSGASPTATATGPATSPGSARGSPTCATSGWTPSGSRPGTSRRSPTAATTSPTTGRSTRRSARLDEAEALIAEALGARHPDDRRHRPEPRLRSARLVPGGTRGRSRARPERERFWFRPGRGANGDEPPNGWPSEFRGGQTWTRTTNPDGTPGEWYLHLFTPEQPDLTGTTPTSGPSTRRSCASGSTGAPPASASIPRPSWPRTRRCRRSRTTRCPARIRIHDRDELHDIYRSLARGRRLLSRAPRPRRRGLAPGRRALRPVPAAGRAAHRLQLRLHGPAVGRAEPARLDRRDAGGARARRRSGHLGAVEPRRHPAGHAIRPPGFVVRLRPEAVGTPTDPRARSASGTGCGAPHRGAARLPVHLPGRRAGARRGRGPSRRDPGPDARPLGRGRSGPRRLPRPAAVERRRPAVRVQPGRRHEPAMAQPARALGGADRRARRPPTPTRC